MSGFLTSSLWPAAGGVAVFIAVWIFLWHLRRITQQAGAEQEQNAQQTEMLEDIQKAQQARDYLRHDAGYARRLRERFTRKT